MKTSKINHYSYILFTVNIAKLLITRRTYIINKSFDAHSFNSFLFFTVIIFVKLLSKQLLRKHE